MSTNRRKSIYVCLALAAVVLIGIAVFCFGCNEKYTDVAVLSTTDMHGKGWDINLLTDQPEKNSMLSVATAAAKTREEFGKDNVIAENVFDLYAERISELHSAGGYVAWQQAHQRYLLQTTTTHT